MIVRIRGLLTGVEKDLALSILKDAVEGAEYDKTYFFQRLEQGLDQMKGRKDMF